MLVRKIQSQPRGFTLLELLIVVVILTVLSSIVLPQFSDMTMDARQSVVNKNVQLVQAALDRYAVEHGGYPNNNTWKNWCPSLDRRHRIGTGYTFLINRLTLFSNGEHQVCDSRQDGGYRYDVEVEANTGTQAQKIVARRESKKLTEV
ncbi:MAG: type II secretion system protein, partial [Granulosicoccaceae bacterium]